MIITSSTLSFASANTQTERESLTSQKTQSNSSSTGKPTSQVTTQIGQENVSLEIAQSNRLYSRSEIRPTEQAEPARILTREEAAQSLVTHAFSRAIEITALNANAASGKRTPTGQPLATQASASFSHAYQLQLEQHSILTMEGTLQLADNSSIDFVLQTRMDSRLNFQSASGAFSQTVVRTDPLVLNLHGAAAQLTNTAFAFDLDGDGSTENVSFATGASGFIAFDRNGDNRINDGSELFGTRSGDGFADLAQYDDDDNGFIDSNDTIYSKLRFYSGAENGTKTLRSLSEVGVAAIGLQSADSPHTIRGNAGQELGSVRSTGIYVMQSGAVGTVQQVDLAKRNMRAEELFSADFDNAQFRVLAPEQASSEVAETDPRILRLREIQIQFEARLDALRKESGDDATKIKTRLELLVDGLKEQLQKMQELRDESHSTKKTT